MLQQWLPFVHTLLKGIGQIMLQGNALTGLLFLAGIFYGSVVMGLGAVLAVCCGSLTAKIFRYDTAETQNGIYGFSAALVGVALPVYFEPGLVIWMAIIIGSVLATMLQHWFIVKKIPAFTFPFVFITWVCLFFFRHVYPVAPPDAAASATPAGPVFAFAFRGFGEVIFQDSLFAGIVFFLGVFISSPVAALYGLAGAAVAALLSSLWPGVPAASIEMGLLSYNAVLCAIVFAGTTVKDGLWALLSITLSAVISLIMAHYNLTPLTFPFVAATCISLLLKRPGVVPSFRHQPS